MLPMDKLIKKKKLPDSNEIQLLEKFNSQKYIDIDDSLLQDIEIDESEERKLLEFLHKEYHEQESRKRTFEEMNSDDDDADEDISKLELTRLLMSRLDSQQNDRYDTYRRTTINKPGIKKLTNQIFPHPLPSDLINLLSSVSKMLVGEVVEKAKDVQLKFEKQRLVERNLLKKAVVAKGESLDGIKLEPLDLNRVPLRPEHIRELWRLYQLENKGVLPSDPWRKQGGNGDGFLFR